MNSEIKHDIILNIAIGKSRKDQHWKNKTWKWSELVERLSETTRTHETVKDYFAATKDRQSEIKDVGGFVAGFIKNGRRLAGNVTARSALTLDLDYADDQFWGTFRMLFSNAACLYSTHKHTPESPRLRLVVPLSREVTPEEYEAVARMVASDLDLEMFDDTSFEPTRLMYWPSTPTDGTYVFEVQDGVMLSPDDVLSLYRDWTDRSQWPVSSRVDAIRTHEMKKIGDPLEKKGVIGAFCNEYDIHSAIETFIPDVYLETTAENRYTYVGGSTAGGLVVYEDKFAFSHHSTDPCGGRLVNSFDLVRLHKFGDLDRDVREGTPINKLPSYVAMEELAVTDPNVQERTKEAMLERIREDFGIPLTPAEGDSDEEEWDGRLEYDGRMNILQTIQNVEIILRNDPNLKNAFALNLFDIREVAMRDLPWRKISRTKKSDQNLKDSDDSQLRGYLEKYYKISNRSVIQDALMNTTVNNAYNPVKDYLDRVAWDGTPRLETLLHDYMGAEQSNYTKEVMIKCAVAAVARVYRPGCKFDNMLTLVGPQGVGKSTFVKKLGKDWFSDSFSSVQGKEAYESLQGVWIMEMGELAGLKKGDLEAVKHFISKCTDRYRVAYGRRTQDFDRQGIFIGTTNEEDFLKDPTGNRRFWPVKVGVVKTKRSVWDITEKFVDQLWGEAVTLYQAGEPLILSPAVDAIATEMQAEHTEQNAHMGPLLEYLDKKLPSDWQKMDLNEKRLFLEGDELSGLKGVEVRQSVTVLDIWGEYFNGNPLNLDKLKSKDIRDMMRQAKGWEPHRVWVGTTVVRGYKRKTLI